MKRPVLFISLLVLTVIALSIVHVSVANSLSTTGITLSRIQHELKQYKKDNLLLKEEILQASALMTVDEQAEAAGFVPIKSQISISNPLPIARR